MPQFVAFVFTEGRGYRVVLEGIGDARVATIAEAESAALRMAERSVFASYPDRSPLDRPGASDRIELELRIVARPPRARGDPAPAP